MALHEQAVGATDEWYTPRYVFEALGCVFDLDVASPGRAVVPWIPTLSHNLKDGLQRDWEGFVWMNPPFGGRNGLRPWLGKFFAHANGIALVPDRTSAPWWQEFTPMADLVLFIAPKIKFINAHGTPGSSPAQGSCLLSIGAKGNLSLRRASNLGLGVLMCPTS